MCSHQKWTLGSICTSFPLLSECFPSILTQNHQNSCLNSLNLEGFKPPSRPHFIGVLKGFGGVLESFDQNLGKWPKNHFSQTWLSLFLSMSYHLKHFQSCPEPWFYGHILEIRPSNKEKWPTSRFLHLKPYQLHLPYLDGISVYRGPPHLFLFGHRLWYLLIISIPLLCFVCFEKSTFSNTHLQLRGFWTRKTVQKSLEEKGLWCTPSSEKVFPRKKGEGHSIWARRCDGLDCFRWIPFVWKSSTLLQSVMHTRFWRKQTSSMQSRIKALHTRLIPRPCFTAGACPHCVCLIHLFPRTKRLTSKGKLNDKFVFPGAAQPRRGERRRKAPPQQNTKNQG